MKHLKIYEDFNFDEEDFDYEEESIYNTEELRNNVILFNKVTPNQPIDIAIKLKSIGEDVYNYDNVMKNRGNHFFSKFVYISVIKSWARSDVTSPKVSITYDQFMKM